MNLHSLSFNDSHAISESSLKLEININEVELNQYNSQINYIKLFLHPLLSCDLNSILKESRVNTRTGTHALKF
jgi:hypothetical protein